MSNTEIEITTTTITTVKINKGSWLLPSGYVQNTGNTGHPVANGQGKAYLHRKVLYDALGDGPHQCHWNPKHLVNWVADPEQGIMKLDVDHLNWDRSDNRRENLVPSCHACNCKRRAPKANK